MSAHALRRFALLTRPCTLPLFVVLLFVALALLFGCGDSNSPDQGHVSGTMWLVGDTLMAGEEPLAGVGVALVNGARYEFIGEAAVTNSDGRYELGPVNAGEYYVVPFGRGHAMHSQSAPRVRVVANETVPHDLQMLKVPIGLDCESVTGTVRDGPTGLPLAGVFVTQISEPGGLLAAGGLFDADLTGADGRFALRAPLDLSIGGQGPQEQTLAPLHFTKPGYRPANSKWYVWDADEECPDFDFEIRMSRDGPTGSIRGRILMSGEPAADIPIMIDWQNWPDETTSASSVRSSRDRAADRKRAVPITGRAVRTEADGTYEFRDLPPGDYIIEPGYLPDDGYMIPVFLKNRHTLAANQRHTMSDIEVLLAITPRAPADGALLSELPPALRWDPVPGAERYEVSLSTEYFDSGWTRSVETNEAPFSWAATPDSLVGPFELTYRWNVKAFAGSTMVAGFESLAGFQVDWDGE